MSNDLQAMLRKVTFFNVFVGAIITLVVFFITPKYTLFVLLGSVIAIINFILNTILTDYFFDKYLNTYKMFMLLSLLLRMFLVSIIGFMLFTYNKFNLVAYMGGYTSHFIGLIIYGANIKNCKGSD